MRALLGEIGLDELISCATVVAPPCPDHRLLAVERQRVELLLQAQYERQRMYTSCGFFFEDFEFDPITEDVFLNSESSLLGDIQGVGFTDPLEEFTYVEFATDDPAVTELEGAALFGNAT
jgi:hypothetical protein